MKFLFAMFLISGLGTYFFYPEKLPAVENNFSAATVDRVEGVYVFVHALPVAEYDVIGSFTVKQKFTGEPKEQMKTALDKLHKDFPGANGIVFTNDNMQAANAVKFK